MVTTLAVCPCSPHAAPGVCLAEGALIAVAGWDALVTGETLFVASLARVAAMTEQIKRRSEEWLQLCGQFPYGAFPDEGEAQPFCQYVAQTTRRLEAAAAEFISQSHAIESCEICSACEWGRFYLTWNSRLIAVATDTVRCFLAMLKTCPVGLKDADCVAIELALRAVREALPTC